MSLLLLCFGSAWGQDPAVASSTGVNPVPQTPAAPPGGEEYLIRGIPPGPSPPPEAVEDIARAIGQQLRCLQCQNESIADSNSNMAINSLQRVRDLVAAGYTEDEIKDSFVDAYGEGILLLPKPKGLNLVVYIVPFVAAGLGIGLVWSTVVQWRKEEDDVPLPSDVGLAPKDAYEERLLAELED